MTVRPAPRRLAAAVLLAGFAAACVAPEDIRSRAPDWRLRFDGAPDRLAACIRNEALNRTLTPPEAHVRDGLLRLSAIGQGLGAVPLSWEITLRPEGLAEVRGFPVVWGGAQGEDAVAYLTACGARLA